MLKLERKDELAKSNEAEEVSTVIENITARKLFNSRGEETLEVDVSTVAGFGRASAPAGASRSKAEVISYPKGKVDLARKQVEKLVAPELIGRNANEQEEIDFLLHEIDGTEDFRNLGGNTAYAVSLAVAEAAATSYGMPLFQHLAGYFADELPCPLGNVLGGGKHAGGKTPDIQEFLVLPINAESFSDAARANVVVHHRIGSLLKRRDATFTGGRGEEGAWAPNIKSEQALEIVAEACDEVSEELRVECRIGLDIAASTLWKQKEELYVYDREGIKRDSGEQLEFLSSLIQKHNLIYVEDPFHEDDFESFAELADGARGCLISGDDLFATSKRRLARGIEGSAGNAIIIKANQVGTLTDAWEATELARKASFVPIMSHRSGETIDTHLSHLSVALHCPIIKTGIMGGTRVAKINELIRIEEILGDRTRMAVLSL